MVVQEVAEISIILSSSEMRIIAIPTRSSARKMLRNRSHRVQPQLLPLKPFDQRNNHRSNQIRIFAKSLPTPGHAWFGNHIDLRL